MAATFFENPQAFRAWLAQNHAKEKELIVGYYKVGSGKPSMSWSESVDQALCFGWIDGIRKSIDKESYSIRFTPRNPKSIWSAINLKKVETLIAAGQMMPAGLAVYALRTIEHTSAYSLESDLLALSPEYTDRFKAHAMAWKYFVNQAPSYRKQMLHWITSAKLEHTRSSRLEKVIAASAEQKRLR